MPSTAPPAYHRQAHRRRRPAPSTAAACLAELEREFAGFRRAHRPQTRIPVELRSAALAALQQGVTPSALRRKCGLSLEQLQQWQGHRGKGSSAKQAAGPEARVFSVVGDRAPSMVEPSCRDGGHLFELRLDGWAISIRRTEP